MQSQSKCSRMRRKQETLPHAPTTPPIRKQSIIVQQLTNTPQLTLNKTTQINGHACHKNETLHCNQIRLESAKQSRIRLKSDHHSPPQRQPLSTTTTTTLHHTCDGDSATDETESSHQDCTMNHQMGVAAKRTPDATTTGEHRTLC